MMMELANMSWNSLKKCYNIIRCFQNRSSIEKDTLLNSTVAYIDKNINSFGAIGDYSRPLVDRYCRLWST